MQPGESVSPGGAPSATSLPSTPAEPANPTSTPTNESPSVVWTASEYLVHHKGGAWYMSLVLFTVTISAVAYFLTKDEITVTMIVIASIIFGIIGARQPRVIRYRIDEEGLDIGPKFYPYDEFKTFSVLQEGSIKSILLLPMKRFMPAVTLYYPPEHEQAIINVLGLYLPHEERRIDPIDRLMRKVRF